MKLSIALCTYNGAAYLSEQLESLAAQTRPPDELVVCDDNSTDGCTADIVRAFARNSPFEVRFSVNRRTLGSKVNFAKAIAHCRGDIIFLCDQDDVWSPGKIARIESALLAAPEAGFVFTDAEVVNEDLTRLGKLSDFFKRETPAGEPAWIFHSLLRGNLVTGATMAFRAAFRNLVLPVPRDTVWQHDGWIALIISAVAPVLYLDEMLIKYRQHSNQQIGVSIAGTKHERRQSPLIDTGGRHPYPTGEIDAFKTAYARLITKCTARATAENMTELRSWLRRLENEKAVLENETAGEEKRLDPDEMQRYLDASVVRMAPYIWKDIFRHKLRLNHRDLRNAVRAITTDGELE